MKMIIRDRCFDTDKCYKWRESFSWLPVKTISGKMVWLSKIYKQRCLASFEGTGWNGNYRLEYVVEYAEFIDIMKMESYEDDN